MLDSLLSDDQGFVFSEHDIRPWGEYFVLQDTSTCKVKKILVNPQQRLSYQKHNHRSEHWIILSGKALVVLDDIEYPLEPNQHIFIPKGSAHRMVNPDPHIPLVFIEIQTGDYFGEDDIIRLQDDYQR